MREMVTSFQKFSKSQKLVLSLFSLFILFMLAGLVSSVLFYASFGFAILSVTVVLLDNFVKFNKDD